MRKMIIVMMLLITLVANAGIYYLTDEEGNVTRHRGDTPYPEGAIWGVAIRSDVPVDYLIFDNGAIRQRTEQEIYVARQAAKPDALKETENDFFDLCFVIFGDYEKRGFDEIETALETLKATDFNAATELSIKLLSIDAMGKRYNEKWWDDAVRHQ